MGIEPLVNLGIYEHFSGHRYEVLALGHHVLGQSTEENVGTEAVVYQALFTSPNYGKRHIWIRPLHNFIEEVEVNGNYVPRFRYIGPTEDVEEVIKRPS